VQPALRNLADLTPELEHLAERLDSVGEIVEGIPGARFLRGRAQAADEEGDKATRAAEAERSAERDICRGRGVSLG